MPEKTEWCPECCGDGTIECDQCGTQIECPTCDGTALDGETYDLSRWSEAEHKFQATHGTTYGLSEGGEYIGRQTLDGKERLLFADFLIGGGV